jgi:hypothetical protein
MVNIPDASQQWTDISLPWEPSTGGGEEIAQRWRDDKIDKSNRAQIHERRPLDFSQIRKQMWLISTRYQYYAMVVHRLTHTSTVTACYRVKMMSQQQEYHWSLTSGNTWRDFQYQLKNISRVTRKSDPPKVRNTMIP